MSDPLGEQRRERDVGTGVDWGRFGRVVALIAFVSAVFLFAAADTLGPDLFQIAVVAIGSVALVTAITGFLIASATALE